MRSNTQPRFYVKCVDGEIVNKIDKEGNIVKIESLKISEKKEIGYKNLLIISTAIFGLLTVANLLISYVF